MIKWVDFENYGIISVVYGNPAERSYERLALSIFKAPTTWRHAYLAEHPLPGLGLHIPYPDTDKGARRAKLDIDRLTPFEFTLYLDADTELLADVWAGFQMLYEGWELVIVPSRQQGPNERFWHIGAEERQYTYDTVGYTPMQFQGGVFFFRKTEAITALFEEWRVQWELYHDQDQAALVRALHKCPVRLWLLGQPYNDGAVIRHRFGQARRSK